MNRNIMKISAILMCVTFAMLLCCACGHGDQSGYEEREISLPEGCDNIWDFNVADDGVMRIAVTEEETQKGYGKAEIAASLGSGAGAIRMPCISRSLKK